MTFVKAPSGGGQAGTLLDTSSPDLSNYPLFLLDSQQIAPAPKVLSHPKAKPPKKVTPMKVPAKPAGLKFFYSVDSSDAEFPSREDKVNDLKEY